MLDPFAFMAMQKVKGGNRSKRQSFPGFRWGWEAR